MILFVDDEKRFAEMYVLELQWSGYEVALHNEVDDALRFFDNRQDQIDLAVLDIMMSPGTSFTGEETEDGIRTGIQLYKKIRKQAPQLPVIFFSDVSDDHLIHWCQKQDLCWVFHKRDLLPHELAEEIRRILTALIGGEYGRAI